MASFSFDYAVVLYLINIFSCKISQFFILKNYTLIHVLSPDYREENKKQTNTLHHVLHVLFSPRIIFFSFFFSDLKMTRLATGKRILSSNIIFLKVQIKY